MNSLKVYNQLLFRRAGRLTIYIFASLLSTAAAMPPHPHILGEGVGAGKSVPLVCEDRIELLRRGIDAPSMTTDLRKATVTGSFRVLAVLIRFSDKGSSVPAEDFDTLLFENRQGAVRHYYNTVSYGQLDIVTLDLPSTIGWNTAPQTYSWYVDHQKGLGGYPQNTQKLCEDIVDLIDPMIDFSQYDNDGDDTVDAIIMIHTGSGYEKSGNVDDIHSHKWAIPARLKDGVYIHDFTVQPEYWDTPGDMTCGVYCHELGHVFGLPDLYDTDYSSRGIGLWSLMSFGSWLGPNYNGSSPAELDAWCRIQLGFTSPVNVLSDLANVSIANVENGGTIYRLWSDGDVGSEYFLVENRQKVGYDAYLPGDGLLIWHIDETKLPSMTPNDNEWYPDHTFGGNYGIALEQADGLFELEKLISTGNDGDPFPGNSSNISFSPLSNPNSNSYAGLNTYVSVSNIFPSGATITADFQVSSSSNVVEIEDVLLPQATHLGQNYPNPFNPSTSINIDLAAVGDVSLSIYDILGREVDKLLDGSYSAGSKTVTWDGTDLIGNAVSSGIYFYELVTDSKRDTKKMTLIR